MRGIAITALIGKAIVELVVFVILYFGVGVLTQCPLENYDIYATYSNFLNKTFSAIDSTSTILNHMDDAIESAHSLEREIYQQAEFAGLNKIPMTVGSGKDERTLSEVFAQLTPSSYNPLDNYRQEWNDGIDSLVCSVLPGCTRDFQPASKPPYELVEQEVDRSVEKYNLFITSVKAVENEINKKVGEDGALGLKVKFENRHERLGAEFSDYDMARETLEKYQYSPYCSAGLPQHGAPTEWLMESISTVNSIVILQLQDNLAGVKSQLEMFYPQANKDWLYNRYQQSKLANDLVSRAWNKLDDVENLLNGYNKVIECLKKGEVEQLISLNGQEYIKECELQDSQGLLKEADIIECYDEKIVALKGEICPTNHTQTIIDETADMVEIINGSPTDVYDFREEDVWGEDLSSRVDISSLNAEYQISTARQELSGALQEKGKDCLDVLDKIEKDMRELRSEIYDLLDDNLSLRVNSGWKNLNKNTVKIQEISLWLSAREINSTVDITGESQYLSSNSKYFEDGETSGRRAFGRLNHMLNKLQKMNAELEEKLSKIGGEVADYLQPELVFIGDEKDGEIKTTLDGLVNLKLYLEFEEHPISEGLSKKIYINHPLYKGEKQVEILSSGKSNIVGQTQDYIRVKAQPIQGTLTQGFTTAKWNYAVLRKEFNITAYAKATLMVPLEFKPDELSISGYEISKSGDQLLIENIKEENNILLDLVSYNPISLGPSTCQAGECTVQVTNNLNLPVSIELMIRGVNASSVTFYGDGEELTTEVTPIGIRFRVDLPVYGGIIKYSGNEPDLSSSGSTSSAWDSLPEDPDNFNFTQLNSKLAEANYFYQELHKAKDQQPKLVYVDLTWLLNSLKNAEKKIKDPDSSNATEIVETTYSTISNELHRVAQVLYSKVMDEYELRKDSVNLKAASEVSVSPEVKEYVDNRYAAPPSYVEYGDNSTWMDPLVSEIQSAMQESNDAEVIEKSLIILDQLQHNPSPTAERYSRLENLANSSLEDAKKNGLNTDAAEKNLQDGKYADSYYNSKNSERQFSLPWWLGPLAIVGIIIATGFAFRDRIYEFKEDFDRKLKDYEKKAEDEEMKKYNF